MHNKAVTTALVVLVALSAATATYAAGCSFAARTFHSYEEVYKCLEQVPFSESLRTSTLDNLRKTFSLYAFRDIVKNSPISGSLTHIQVDLNKEFDRIASAKYDSDWDFQDDIANVVMQLRDPQYARLSNTFTLHVTIELDLTAIFLCFDCFRLDS